MNFKPIFSTMWQWFVVLAIALGVYFGCRRHTPKVAHVQPYKLLEGGTVILMGPTATQIYSGKEFYASEAEIFTGGVAIGLDSGFVVGMNGGKDYDLISIYEQIANGPGHYMGTNRSGQFGRANAITEKWLVDKVAKVVGQFTQTNVVPVVIELQTNWQLVYSWQNGVTNSNTNGWHGADARRKDTK